MSSTWLDIIVVLILFAVGMVWTAVRYGKRDRLAFAVVAVLSPFIVVAALFSVIFQVIRGKADVGPCPPGLAEAERLVEVERQRMFGGELRRSTFSLRWQRTYELELQREAESVKRIAQRVFVNA